jgi:hypothetical protein
MVRGCGGDHCDQLVGARSPASVGATLERSAINATRTGGVVIVSTTFDVGTQGYERDDQPLAAAATAAASHDGGA